MSTIVNAHNFVDLSGQRFGRLVALHRTSQKKKVRWVCKCDCGTVKEVSGKDLGSGGSRSCGCLVLETRQRRRESSLNLNNRREHNSWAGMRQRCSYPGHIEYHRYGGRGISVCSRWSSFANFLADMGPRPPGTSLDRIDGDAGYSPENCQWATKKVQSSNTSRNIFVEWEGERMTLKSLAEKLQVSYDRLHSHHRDHGKPLAEAVAATLRPVRRRT